MMIFREFGIFSLAPEIQECLRVRRLCNRRSCRIILTSRSVSQFFMKKPCNSIILVRIPDHWRFLFPRSRFLLFTLLPAKNREENNNKKTNVIIGGTGRKTLEGIKDELNRHLPPTKCFPTGRRRKEK